MVRIESKATGFEAVVSATELGRVLVSAAKGDKAAHFTIKSNEEVTPFVCGLKDWLGFGVVMERKLVTAILEERAS